MMPGGTKAAYDAIEPLVRKMAAQVDDGPCVTYIGPGGAGHFVKTVHNGIEYGIEQILAEAYDLMKRVDGLNGDQMADVLAGWNDTEELASFLVEITEVCLRTRDPHDGSDLVEKIVDAAGVVPGQRVLEIGPGLGALTTALLARGAEVVAVEPDPLASAGLERMAQDQGWTDRLRLAPASLARDDAALRALISDSEAILVDPPRSGMGALPAALSSTPGPRWLLSVSCHADSFVDDLAALIAGGWSLRASAGIDQFPQSPHAEWLALLWRPAAVPG